MWLAESYEYSPDYKTLTIKTRPNVTWSDGEPFSANDVAYTFNQLVEVGPAVKWGADVQQFLDGAEVTDENTVVCNFKVPAPRFFDFVAYKFDIGVYIMPEHIFKDQNFAEFAFFDHREGLAGDDGALAGRLLQDRAEGSRPRRRLVGRRSGRWRAAGHEALRLSARSRRAGSHLRHHRQPVRHRHRYPTCWFRHGLRRATTRSRPGPARSRHSATSTGGRTPSTSTTRSSPGATRMSAGRSATTSIASRSSTSRGWAPVCPPRSSCPTIRRCKPFLEAVQPLIERVPIPGAQPGQG